MTPSQRTDINEAAFIQPAAEVADIKLRPFSLGSLSICRRAKLTMLTGDAKPEDLSEDEKQHQIVAFLFIQSRPIPEVLRAINDPATFADRVLEFSMGLPVTAIPQAVGAIQQIMDQVNAAYVEVQAKPDDKPEDEPPNS